MALTHLEEGKYYRTRKGDKILIVRFESTDPGWTCSQFAGNQDGRLWAADGSSVGLRFSVNPNRSGNPDTDIIALWEEPLKREEPEQFGLFEDL